MADALEDHQGTVSIGVGGRTITNLRFPDDIDGLAGSEQELENLVRIRQAIGPYEDLLTTIKRRKLKWFGHVTRRDGLVKTVLQGAVRGGRKRGRQKKRWEDNITEWTGLKLSEAVTHAKDREGWKGLVARSSVAPQRQPPWGR
ncbi:uncharacterized protein [Diadema antillarum]|uniref:uncharacterized protein n=1 Tax=Diadema antillarum TaxID=105358 RepID=UPI003A87B0A2